MQNEADKDSMTRSLTWGAGAFRVSEAERKHGCIGKMRKELLLLEKGTDITLNFCYFSLRVEHRLKLNNAVAFVSHC